MKEVYIISAVRTPIGSFGGSLSSLTAPQLGAAAIQGALEKAGIPASMVEEVYMGNVLSAGIGQAPARQAAIYAGLAPETVCTTINKVCASGSKAVMLAAQTIMLGQAEVIIAGGMESMSNVPYYDEKTRFGAKLGHIRLTDGIIKDGLWDVYNDFHMGNAAEITAREMKIDRKMQDDYAMESYRRSASAWENGFFKDEITPVSIPQHGKDPLSVLEDEEYKKVNFEKLPSLKPVFEKEGTVTAANASTLNDGASALLLMSREKAEALGLKPRARILAFADAEQKPEWFTTSPALAIPKALKNAGVKKKEVDFYEINEAFSVVSIANNMKLDLDPGKVNICGGAVSLGHPIGCSGARIITTLLNVLEKKGGRIGVSGICNGGGGASALVIEKL